MLVDYHFHPNLSKHNYFAKRKCAKIWRAFARKKMDVVVVTEHVYKNPPRAYRLLQETRPADATTVIFPGLEALTSEGIDMIIFGYDEQLYTHQKIMVPKQLSQVEMIHYIKEHSDIVGSIAHPALSAHSGSERRVGREATIQAIRALGGAEIANACFTGTLHFGGKIRLDQLLKGKTAKLMNVMRLKPDYYEFPEVTLYTGGSDAHIVEEIGSGMVVADAPLTDRSAVFQAIRSNTSTEFNNQRVRFLPYLTVYKLYTVIRETLIKAFRLYEGKIYQHDDAFTNYYGEAEKEIVLAWRVRRAILLKPILNFLTYFGISPTLLNIVSFLLIIASVVQVTQSDQVPAIVYFGLYLMANGLTGPLERYQKLESEVSAITKIILYQFALICGVLAAMALDWVNSWLGAVYLLLYIIMLWLMITLNKVGRPLHLVVRSKNIVLGAMLLKILTDINWLMPIVGGFSIYMAVMNVIMVVRLLQVVAEHPDQHI